MRNFLNKLLLSALQKKATKDTETVIYIDCQTRQVNKCTIEEWDFVYSQITVTETDGIKKKYMRIEPTKTEPQDYEYQFAKAINDFGDIHFEMVEYKPGFWTSKIKK